MQHPRKPDVGRVLHLAARPGAGIDALRRAPDGFEWAGRPGIEGVLLDQDPLLRELAFDLFLGPYQARQERIASSIFG
jgi:hypothetical protein